MEMALAQGFVLSLSVLGGVGPQNLFVMRSAARREGILLVISICLMGEAVFLVAAYWAGASLGSISPRLLSIVALGGALLLAWYALQILMQGKAPTAVAPSDNRTQGQVKIALGAFAVTFLNPLVYVDIIAILGSTAYLYPSRDRPVFLIGAFLASCIWFPFIAYVASYLRRRLGRLVKERVLNIAFAIYLLACAVQLGVLVAKSF